jgi:tellurite methyltransferase
MANQPDTPSNQPRPGVGASTDADWPAYFNAVEGLPPRDTLLAALVRFDAETSPERQRGVDPPLAIDLGCGQGRDTFELLRRGWRILAIDNHSEGLARLNAKVTSSHPTSDIPHPTSLQTLLADFTTIPLPPCTLVNASFSIPHCDPAAFPAMWSRIVASIQPGGRFAGQLFGVRDEWAAKPDGITRTYHSREQVESLLAPFTIELLDEVERPGKTALGEPKYWHVFHIVARKKPG